MSGDQDPGACIDCDGKPAAVGYVIASPLGERPMGNEEQLAEIRTPLRPDGDLSGGKRQ